MNNTVRIVVVVFLAIGLVLGGLAAGYLVWGTRSATFGMMSFDEDTASLMHDFDGGSGLMGYGSAGSGEEVTSLDEALEAAEAYIEEYYPSQGLEITEVMWFDNHFYAQTTEEDTGIGAFEILIDPQTGAIQPEYGPNMMWNEKYGMMGGGMGMMGSDMMGFETSSNIISKGVSPAEAGRLAQQFLDQHDSGLTVNEEVDAFYGYYTIHTLENEMVTGMLSVHDETGDVWPHTWHGEFLGMTEHQQDE